MRLAQNRLLRLAVPLGGALLAMLLAERFVAPGVDVAALSRGMVGPTTWPKAMLYCAALCAAGMFVVRLVESARPSRPAEEPSPYHEGRSAAAVGLLVAYGIAIPFIGLAWATLAFLAAWIVLGGVRRPALVTLVATLGTAGILYLFVKVSLMPLDRGKGVFEQATVALYRVLGIY
jgi:putative tricarboxylic transport membrane protein